ncbi:AEC family transporter [Clostridium sp. E02]|uniref:AEC family transporter n=1 Tax=Clostridium sp. E02 TaxID=2487134 RepID=UPI000F53C4D1|nr:AEC family transporter [Clostridium sp. E02]
MDLVISTCGKIAEMFILILLGVMSFKCRLIDESTSKKLSNFLLMLVAPCLIINSYQIEYRPELIQGLFLCLVFSFISFALDVAIAQLVIRPKSGPNLAIDRMGIIYSNCAFIGIPLVEGVLGKEGVFYVSAYLTVFNILIWTHGVSLMVKGVSMKENLKNLNTPTIYAIFLGLLLFFLQFKIPSILLNPIASVGSMNTPLAMLIAGVNLAQSDFLRSFKSPRTYLMSFIKLIVIPMATLLMLMILRAERNTAFVVFICAACPTGAMTTMFALRYHKDARYASEMFCTTTFFSMITIPVLTFLAGILL